MESLPNDAVLAPDSLVLVTGANGFIAALICDELIAHGLRVRGTVRDPAKESSAWMPEYFEKTYGSGRFEMVQVAHLDRDGSLDNAVKGCSALIHTASDTSFSPDPHFVVTKAIAFVTNALNAAAKEPGLKRFVMTSSSSAAQQWHLNEVYDLTDDCWDEVSIKKAWEPPPYEMDRALYVYNASKAQSEQALWKFVREHKPNFVVNAVLPDFVCGLPVNSEKQGWGPSNGIAKRLWDGQDGWQILYPQFGIDARDTALLHVAAATKPDTEGRRLFGYAWNKTWADWIGRLREMYSGHAFSDPPPKEGKDMANVVGRKEAEDALKWLGKEGWRPMEESMREIFDCFERDGK